MNSKRKCRPPVDHRVYLFHLPGKSPLTPGIEVSLKGKRGRYRFRYATPPLPTERQDKPTVLTFVGGPLDGQGEKFVSAYPESVMRVHRINKTLTNIQRDKALFR